jgi:protein phosphatase
VGFLVVGDIHNEFEQLQSVVDFATSKDLDIIFVGDLVDYGPNPAEVILLANSLPNAQFIEGNHDNKIHRYAKGNDVIIGENQQGTVDALEDPVVREAWAELYNKMSSFINIGDTYITHAGFSAEFWEGDFGGKTKKTFLFGETDPTLPMVERFGNKYPHRSYGWTGSIPAGKTVIVGHDRSPFQQEPAFDSNINKVVVSENEHGGTVIFTDTGSGKGGFVSGVIIDDNGVVDSFVSFNEDT